MQLASLKNGSPYKNKNPEFQSPIVPIFLDIERHPILYYCSTRANNICLSIWQAIKSPETQKRKSPVQHSVSVSTFTFVIACVRYVSSLCTFKLHRLLFYAEKLQFMIKTFIRGEGLWTVCRRDGNNVMPFMIMHHHQNRK